MGVNKNRVQRNQKTFKNSNQTNKKQLTKFFSKKPFSKGFLSFKSLSIKSSLLYSMVVLIANLLIPSSNALAYNANKEIISGDKEKLIQTVALISSFTPVIKNMKSDLSTDKEEVFIEKPEIIQTKTRAEIDEEKKQEEIKKALEYERTVVARERQSTTQSTTSAATELAITNTNNANSYFYGFCTWYAASRRSDVPGNWGNASSWLSSAQSSGRDTGSDPKAGAIIVTYESWFGHVGYVENVEGDKVTISEMNFLGWGIVNYRSLDKNNPVIHGYIY